MVGRDISFRIRIIRVIMSMRMSIWKWRMRLRRLSRRLRRGRSGSYKYNNNKTGRRKVVVQPIYHGRMRLRKRQSMGRARRWKLRAISHRNKSMRRSNRRSRMWVKLMRKQGQYRSKIRNILFLKRFRSMPSKATKCTPSKLIRLRSREITMNTKNIMSTTTTMSIMSIMKSINLSQTLKRSPGIMS